MRFKVKNTHLGGWIIVTAEDKDAARIEADKNWRAMDHSDRWGYNPDLFGGKNQYGVTVTELPDQGNILDHVIAKIAGDLGDAVGDAAYPYGDEGAGYDYDDAVRFLIARGYKIIPPRDEQPEEPDYTGGDAHHACRHCQHALAKHNSLVGCKQCDCAASVGEARPQNDAELDAAVQA